MVFSVATAAMQKAVISLPRLDQDYAEEEKPIKQGLLSPRLAKESGLETSPHYINLTEFHASKKLLLDKNFPHRCSAESCSSRMYSIAKTHSNAFTRPGKHLSFPSAVS